MFIEITDPETSNPILININNIVSVLLAEETFPMTDYENVVAIGLTNGSIAYAKEEYFEIKHMISQVLKGEQA